MAWARVAVACMLSLLPGNAIIAGLSSPTTNGTPRIRVDPVALLNSMFDAGRDREAIKSEFERTVGRTEREIVACLGPPDRRVSNGMFDHISHYKYGSLNPELEIVYDDNGRVYLVHWKRKDGTYEWFKGSGRLSYLDKP
jgi:hypothetical protein